MMGKWFWLTFKGWQVDIATLDKFYHIKYRPFKQPQIWTSLMNPKNKRYTHIYFDEASDIDESVSDLVATDSEANTESIKSAPNGEEQG